MANLENMRLSLDLMKRVRDEKKPFSLAYWEKDVRLVNQDWPIASGKPENADCGMVCCMGGYMMNDPAHNALGLKRQNHLPFIIHAITNLDAGITEFGTDALAVFWDIPTKEAEGLTLSLLYPRRALTTIDEVIDRLEATIEAFAGIEAVNQLYPA